MSGREGGGGESGEMEEGESGEVEREGEREKKGRGEWSGGEGGGEEEIHHCWALTRYIASSKEGGVTDTLLSDLCQTTVSVPARPSRSLPHGTRPLPPDPSSQPHPHRSAQSAECHAALAYRHHMTSSQKENVQ